MNTAEPVEIWRGGVNASDCDEMGHMNVRIYLRRAQEGLGALALNLGLPGAFAPNATASLIVQAHSVRFLKEAHVGAPLHMTGGVIAFGETDATLLQVLYHSRTGEPAAAFKTQVAHAKPGDGRAFPWPKRAIAAAAALRVETPDFAQPRSAPVVNIDPAAPLDAEQLAAMICTGRGMVMAENCDLFGRMTPDAVLARLTEGVGGLMQPLRLALAAETKTARIGGAALEYRLTYHALPRIGDHLEIRARLAEVGGKVQRLAFVLRDPISGRTCVTADGVVASLDLDARKIVALPAAFQARWQPGLGPA